MDDGTNTNTVIEKYGHVIATDTTKNSILVTFFDNDNSQFLLPYFSTAITWVLDAADEANNFDDDILTDYDDDSESNGPGSP